MLAAAAAAAAAAKNLYLSADGRNSLSHRDEIPNTSFLADCTRL